MRGTVWGSGDTVQASELKVIVEESSRRLLQISIPTVRFYLLTDIMGLEESDPRVQKAAHDCRMAARRRKLLETLRPDGTWPISRERRLAEERGPGGSVGWTYITILRNLYDLAEYRTTMDEGYVKQALEKILSWQSEDGYIPGPSYEFYPDTPYNGYALRMLLKFGMQKDPRVQRLIRWLLRMQRPDGGWVIPLLQDLKYYPPYRSMNTAMFHSQVARKIGMANYTPSDYYKAPSCIWTTMMVVRGFVQSFDLGALPEVRRGAEYFLDRFFMKNYYSSFLRSDDNWTKLKYPTYFGSGMCALDILTWMGYGAKDSRMEKPISWLLGMRMQDGLWCQSDRPHPEKDQNITEVCLSVINRYAQSMEGLPFGREAEIELGRTAPV